MKKTLLSLAVIAIGFWAQSQVVVEGVSPAAIQGNYDFRAQANCGAWPGETDDNSWNVLSNIDFNVPGANVTAELMLVEDGSPGTNLQGNPVSQEGCNPLTNSLTGKIAVIYRNTCFFSDKIYNAEVAGAVAAIIINREPGLIGMTAGPSGVNVTIPAVFLSNSDGAALVTEMGNGPVTMFIGNKLGINPNDLTAYEDGTMRSPFRTTSNLINNGFDLGIQLYNFGANANTPTVNATVVGPGATTYYDETVTGPSLNTGDTLPVFPGNPTELPRFDLGIGNYPNGDYTITYTITGSAPDDAPYDNVITSMFTVTNDYMSLATNDASGNPTSNSYPVGLYKPADYQSCMFVSDSMAGNLAITGLSFVPYADTLGQDTTGITLAGSEIFIDAYLWNDAWPNTNDPAWFGANPANNAYANIENNLLDFTTHYPLSDNEIGVPASVNFNAPITLLAGERYLFCVQSFDTNIVFGYENGLDYGANYSIYGMPVSPVKGLTSTGSPQWYAAGWTGIDAASITLNVAAAGINEENSVNGMAFPNPANDMVTIKIEANGGANVTVTDISGKLSLSESVELSNGMASINIDALEPGMYVFNVELENGLTSQFNVVKQ